MAHMWGAHLAPTLRGACDLLARDVRYSTYFSEVPTQAWGGAILQCSMPNQNDTRALGKCGAAALTARPLP